MSRSFVASLCLLLLATVALAQEEPRHPIDKAFDACSEKDPSTAGMVKCMDKLYQAWDQELNKNYGQLLGKLKPAQKGLLRASQLEWIKHRDADFKLIDSIYARLPGQRYDVIPMRLDERAELVRRRALQLKGFLDITEASP
jgi:uncharacterized protein YecT (DUF1311 family)